MEIGAIKSTVANLQTEKEGNVKLEDLQLVLKNSADGHTIPSFLENPGWKISRTFWNPPTKISGKPVNLGTLPGFCNPTYSISVPQRMWFAFDLKSCCSYLSSSKIPAEHHSD
jgi:hypothetical protein